MLCVIYESPGEEGGQGPALGQSGVGFAVLFVTEYKASNLESVSLPKTVWVHIQGRPTWGGAGWECWEYSHCFVLSSCNCFSVREPIDIPCPTTCWLG